MVLFQVTFGLDLAAVESFPRQLDGAEERLHAQDRRLAILIENEGVAGFIRSHQRAQGNESIVSEQIPIPVLDVLDLPQRERELKSRDAEELESVPSWKRRRFPGCQ